MRLKVRNRTSTEISVLRARAGKSEAIRTMSELERNCADKEISSGVVIRWPRAVPSLSDFARAKVGLESSLDFSERLNIDDLGSYIKFHREWLLL